VVDGPSLAGCDAKLQRAREHLRSLQFEAGFIEEDVRRRSIQTRLSYDVESDIFKLRVASDSTKIPDRFSTIGGDAIQNLRIALEYLAYQAVWKNRGTPWEHTKWPIRTDPVLFNSSEKKLFRKAGTKFTTLIKRNQPFRLVEHYKSIGINDVEEIMPLRKSNRLLGVLQELSNFEKHKLLLDPFCRMHGIRTDIMFARNCHPVQLWYEDGVPMKANAQITGWKAHRTGSENPEMKVNFAFEKARICLQFGGPAVEDIAEIADKVEDIIDEFRRYF
jgi:hypothetical protein